MAPQSFSAHRFLYERGDPCLISGGRLLKSEFDWPHGALVEVRRVAEAQRRVSGVELLRGFEVVLQPLASSGPSDFQYSGWGVVSWWCQQPKHRRVCVKNN